MRAHFYVCSANYRKGPSVCANDLIMPLAVMDSAVIGALAPLLTTSFAETVVRKVLVRAVPVGPEKDQKRSALVEQLGEVRRQLDNLIDGLARTGSSPRLTAAIRDREARQAHLEHELDALEQRTLVSEVELQRIKQLARQKVDSCVSFALLSWTSGRDVRRRLEGTEPTSNES